MHSNNMEDFTGKFRAELHDAYNELTDTPCDDWRVPLGTMKLEDGRPAQVQLVVTTVEDDFLADA